MTQRTKKILAIIGFVVSTIAIGGALYFVFFRPAPPPTEPTEEPAGPGAFPGAEPGAPPVAPGEETPDETPGLEPLDEVAQGGRTQTTVLTNTDISQTSLSGDGRRVNYYDPSDSRFYRIDEDGDVERLSDAQFPQAESVAWNSGGDKAVIEFPDGSNVVYDFVNERQTTLPQHWEDFQFSPTQDKISAKSMTVDPSNRWLVTTNADGSNVQAVQALGENADKVQPSWSPNDQVIAFSDTGNAQTGGLDRKMIIPIGQNNENMKGLTVEGIDFRPNWAPDGQRLLYSVAGSYSNYQPLLWVVDGTSQNMGENRRSLGLNTWADKCSFANGTTLYCAVPRSMPANAGLQPGLAANVPDDLYRVDLSAGRSELVAVPETDTQMLDLRVTNDGTRVYYQNADTGQLETIRLR